MALDLTTLTAMRDALLTARSKGLLQVRDSNGESVTYASLDAMGRTIADLESRIASLQRGQVNVVKLNYDKGI